MNIKSLVALILQLVCLPAIANNSQETIQKQYQKYMAVCSDTSFWQSNPQFARNICKKAIEVDPNNPDISNPYLFKSIITIMFTDELKKAQSKTIFESTYKDLTKVIDNSDSVGQKSQASSYRLFTELIFKKKYKKYLGSNLCSDLERGLNHKMGRDLTQILMATYKNLKKECP